MEARDEQERARNGNLGRDLDPETIALIGILQAQRAEEHRRAFALNLANTTLREAEVLRPGRTIEDRTK